MELIQIKMLLGQIWLRRSRWPMSSVLGLASFGLQAAAALAQMLAASRVFTKSDYASFSLGIATASLWAVLGLEWLRSAVARFAPVACGRALTDLRNTWNAGYVYYVGVTMAAMLLVAFAAPNYRGLAAAVAFIALTQGYSDLALTILRSRGRWNTFAVRQSVRAVGSTMAAVLAALTTKSAEFTLCAYGIGLMLPFLDVPKMSELQRVFRSDFPFRGLEGCLRYGLPVALTSVAFIGVPVTVRWWVSGLQGLEEAAGWLLAIDLYQRPFGVLLGAVVAFISPALMRSHDQASSAGQQRKSMALSQIRVLVIGVTLALFCLLTSGPVNSLLVPKPLSASFVTIANSAIVFSFSQAVLQYCGTLPFVVNKEAVALIRIFSINIAVILAFLMLPVPQGVDFNPPSRLLAAGVLISLYVIFTAISGLIRAQRER